MTEVEKQQLNFATLDIINQQLRHVEVLFVQSLIVSFAAISGIFVLTSYLAGTSNAIIFIFFYSILILSINARLINRIQRIRSIYVEISELVFSGKDAMALEKTYYRNIIPISNISDRIVIRNSAYYMDELQYFYITIKILLFCLLLFWLYFYYNGSLIKIFVTQNTGWSAIIFDLFISITFFTQKTIWLIRSIFNFSDYIVSELFAGILVITILSLGIFSLVGNGNHTYYKPVCTRYQGKITADKTDSYLRLVTNSGYVGEVIELPDQRLPAKIQLSLRKSSEWTGKFIGCAFHKMSWEPIPLVSVKSTYNKP